MSDTKSENVIEVRNTLRVEVYHPETGDHFQTVEVFRLADQIKLFITSDGNRKECGGSGFMLLVSSACMCLEHAANFAKQYGYSDVGMYCASASKKLMGPITQIWEALKTKFDGDEKSDG